MPGAKHRVGLALFTVVLGAACSSAGSGSGGTGVEDAGLGCTTDADCSGALVCKAGRCVDPPKDTGVDTGTCKHPGEGCGGDGDCCQSGDPKAPKGAACISNDHACHAKCDVDGDCASGCCAPVEGESYKVCAETSACCACASGSYTCSGSTTLETCDDGCHWSMNSCASLCKSAGYDGASGCGMDSTKGHDTCECFYGGIGDACTDSSTCSGSEYCASLAHWCNESGCTRNADCQGTGPGGRNHANGDFNYCFHVTSGGSECFPGCATDADCLPYGFGACKSFTDVEGTTHSVCSEP